MQLTDTTPITLGVIGAGAMGTGIAHVAISNGITVKLFDSHPQAATRARDSIAARLAKRVQDGKLDALHADRAVSLLEPQEKLEGLADCNVVIEAIVEKLEVKSAVFQKLEEILPSDAIIASNTSSIPIGVLAAACRHRERIAGLHFFNPVPLMKLVEVIPGPDTRAEVIEGLMELSRRMGKVAVLAKDMPGFLVNFGGRAFPTEGLAIVHEGVATPAQVDAVMRDCYGFRMGPFELMDLTGLDVNYPVTRLVHESFFFDPRLRSTPLHRYKMETGQLGRKAGRGFYRHGEEAGTSDVERFAATPVQKVCVHGDEGALSELLAACNIEVDSSDDGSSAILIAPYGDDVSSYAANHGLDHRRIIAVDVMGDTSSRVTLMYAPGVDDTLRNGVAARFASERKVTLIEDSPGFIGQRIIAMLANLGCEMAQTRLASIEDIDNAMRLGLNYPQGPLEMADIYGVGRIYALMQQLQRLTGDDRYRPSQWLRRRAQLGLSARTV